MTSLAPLASIGDTLVTLGLYVVAAAFIASASVAIAAHLAYRYTTKQERGYDQAPAPDSRDQLRVIGGNRISSDERWAA